MKFFVLPILFNLKDIDFELARLRMRTGMLLRQKQEVLKEMTGMNFHNESDIDYHLRQTFDPPEKNAKSENFEVVKQKDFTFKNVGGHDLIKEELMKTIAFHFLLIPSVIFMPCVYAEKIVLKSRTDYELFASRNMFYDSKMEEKTTKGLEQSTDLIQDFELNTLGLETFTLRGILYDLDKANIRPDAAKVLDSLILVLNKYPTLKIELGSHTDCRGKDEYNQKLSENRAKSVVKYCTLRDIDPKRLTYKGYGESQPKETCVCESCTEEQHQTNRRTVFKVIK
jgi:outer membrane protein OmpA-like peptidoglycan-associated protein